MYIMRTAAASCEDGELDSDDMLRCLQGTYSVSLCPSHFTPFFPFVGHTNAFIIFLSLVLFRFHVSHLSQVCAPPFSYLNPQLTPIARCMMSGRAGLASMSEPASKQ